jgi:hypothetical protein
VHRGYSIARLIAASVGLPMPFGFPPAHARDELRAVAQHVLIPSGLAAVALEV